MSIEKQLDDCMKYCNSLIYMDVQKVVKQPQY